MLKLIELQKYIYIQVFGFWHVLEVELSHHVFTFYNRINYNSLFLMFKVSGVLAQELCMFLLSLVVHQIAEQQWGGNEENFAADSAKDIWYPLRNGSGKGPLFMRRKTELDNSTHFSQLTKAFSHFSSLEVFVKTGTQQLIKNGWFFTTVLPSGGKFSAFGNSFVTVLEQ